MISISSSHAVTSRYGALLCLLSHRRRGRTMRDLADAFALAQELEADTPDRPAVAALVERLGLDLAAVEGAA